MADRGYVGRHRERIPTPVLWSRHGHAVMMIAATLAAIGTMSVAVGDVAAPGTPRTEAVAQQGTAGHTARTSTAVRTPAESGDLRLGGLTVHFDATRPITTTIVGDDINRRLSWNVQVSNTTGAAITIGDPMAILWATDGSGHIAVSRQRVPSGSRRAVAVSFDLPKVLEPSSITLTLGSAKAEVRVKGS